MRYIVAAFIAMGAMLGVSAQAAPLSPVSVQTEQAIATGGSVEKVCWGGGCGGGWRRLAAGVAAAGAAAAGVAAATVLAGVLAATTAMAVAFAGGRAVHGAGAAAVGAAAAGVAAGAVQAGAGNPNI